VFFRLKEVSARANAISDLNKKLGKVVALMTKWETTMPQVTEEERADVLAKVEDVRKWISEKTEAQAAADPTSDPVFTSDEVPLQTTEVQKVVSKLSRKPKPVPKKEEKKNETESEGGDGTDTEDLDGEATPDDKKDSEDSSEEPASEDSSEKPASEDSSEKPASEEEGDEL
jgi:hypoxia up-regulated 1